MKSKLIFDSVRKRVIADAEIKRLALGYLVRSQDMPAKTRLFARLRLAEMPARTCATRLNRRCILTGRVRSVLDEFNINRMRFREMALRGELFGVQKASW